VNEMLEEIVDEIEGAGTSAGDRILAEMLFGIASEFAKELKTQRTTVRDLPAEKRKEYQREAVAKHRAKVRAERAKGTPEPTRDAVREALADAALMLLAVSGPGSDQVRAYLDKCFPGRPGVAMTVTSKARSTKLRPKLLKSS
jgi:hypothetical protein